MFGFQSFVGIALYEKIEMKSLKEYSKLLAVNKMLCLFLVAQTEQSLEIFLCQQYKNNPRTLMIPLSISLHFYLTY